MYCTGMESYILPNFCIFCPITVCVPGGKLFNYKTVQYCTIPKERPALFASTTFAKQPVWSNETLVDVGSRHPKTFHGCHAPFTRECFSPPCTRDFLKRRNLMQRRRNQPHPCRPWAQTLTPETSSFRDHPPHWPTETRQHLNIPSRAPIESSSEPTSTCRHPVQRSGSIEGKQLR